MKLLMPIQIQDVMISISVDGPMDGTRSESASGDDRNAITMVKKTSLAPEGGEK